MSNLLRSGRWTIRAGTMQHWMESNPYLLDREFACIAGTNQYKVGPGNFARLVLAQGGGKLDATENWENIYGSGEHGDVVLSARMAVNSQDFFPRNLTMVAGGILVTSNFRVQVSGILDISLAIAGAISCNGNNGASASGSTQGTVNSSLAAGTTAIISSNGGQGAAGTLNTITGGSGGSVGTTANCLGGVSAGRGGFGGANGLGTAGGVAGTVPTVVQRILGVYDLHFLYGTVLCGSAIAGSGGASGCSDGVNLSGGGGTGGGAAGNIQLAARTINRGASTAVGAIQCNGGNGGNGGNATGGSSGGGGAGGSGCGGFIQLAYMYLTGTTATNCLETIGGTGGNGGNGSTTGASGFGGNGASSGRIHVYPSLTGIVTPYASVLGSANSGATGGAGGVLRVDL